MSDYVSRIVPARSKSRACARKQVLTIICHISTTKMPMNNLVAVQRLSNYAVLVVVTLSCVAGTSKFGFYLWSRGIAARAGRGTP